MTLKSIMLTLAIVCLGASVSFETASAGKKRDQMSGRVKGIVGCELQPKNSESDEEASPGIAAPGFEDFVSMTANSAT
jgi:hypothetical protein